MPTACARDVEQRERLRQRVGVDDEAVRGRLRRPAREQHALDDRGPSSSIDAFAVSRPVRSATIVWKLMSASSRPCEISGWYGVYAVYQLGFSSTFRWITAGVTVPE